MNPLREAAQQALQALEWIAAQKTGGMIQRKSTEPQDALRAALAQQAEPVQDQDVEDAIEAAYWQFDCRKKGLNEWASAPQSERDAFKAEARKLVRGYFPTRQAQDTKREMLAVADAFIRGKRAALAQQAEPVQEPVAKCIDDICSEHLGRVEAFDHLPRGTLLYATPPRRTMVPLTEEEIDALPWNGSPQQFARAVEKASWKKNHGQA